MLRHFPLYSTASNITRKLLSNNNRTTFIGPKANGGVVSSYNGMTIHTFTSPGTFDVNTGPLSVEYVMIGGGGGGAYGGGGAGGYFKGTTTVSPGPNPITIGAGGNGAPTYSTQGSNGTTSTFNGITATSGGGGGTAIPPSAGSSGGSGGGGGSFPGSGSPGGTGSGDTFPGNINNSVPANGWGNDGGPGAYPVGGYGYGGGGGGAGSVGSTGGPGGTGGTGVQLPSTFRDPSSTVGAPGPTSSPFTGTDSSGLYWVAGGGAGGFSGFLSPGGSFGGGAGGGGNTTPTVGENAVENTGSGGGAASSSPHKAGNGGSGIVLIAYPS